ncbi:MAG TPA: hypothetical protein VJ673_16515 [Aromatoleum sp.]|uniref:hypothetical protein n=1 Tax=Aromatoleum sp. TaxID=2307007 RepID=UPI002B4725AA|nr:hypothetical protein [Aromatoleum sp.]HJV27292.1 hypothetical protein [Aromatoleum sp.]
MRKSAIAAALAFILLIPVGASGHLKTAVPDSRAALGPTDHFGAQLVLTPDEQGFAEALVSRSRLPQLPWEYILTRGSSVTAVLVFQGCATNGAGRCDVVAEFSVISPSGTEMSGGAGELWSDPPVPGGLHIGNSSVGLSFGQDDAVGQYHIIANVTDQVSGRRLMLDSPLTLRE